MPGIPIGTHLITQSFTFNVPAGSWDSASLAFRGVANYVISYSVDYSANISNVTFQSVIGGAPSGDLIQFPYLPLQPPNDSSQSTGTVTKNVPFNCEIVFPAVDANYQQALAYINSNAGGTVTFQLSWSWNSLNDATTQLSLDLTSLELHLCGKKQPDCTFSINPFFASYPATGGVGSFAVAVTSAMPSSCMWQAVSQVPWITITSGQSGTGNGSVGYTVDVNPAPNASRVGTIFAAGYAYIVTQSGDTISGTSLPVIPQTTACADCITRPFLRDEIRRKLGITPPIDDIPGAKQGEEPPGQLYPPNAVLNMAITDALSEMNRMVGFKVSGGIQIPVPTTQGFGFQSISLLGAIGAPMKSVIDKVIRVIWKATGSTTIVPLRYYDTGVYETYDISTENTPPSAPTTYKVYGQSLQVFPGSSRGGQLTVYTTTAFYDFCSETDCLNGLPLDYAYVVKVIAARNVAMMRPVDFQYYIQLYGEAAQKGLSALQSWQHAQSDQGTPRFKLSPKYDVRSRRGRR